MSKPTLLLTGATGVLGRAFIKELADDYHLIGLRHRTPIDDPRVEEIQGSLGDEHLGLGQEGFEELAARVDVVLHSAARTGWRATREQLFASNVTGTEYMLGLARQAGAPFYYVSTAFVARPQDEELRESGPAAYVDSKAAAEQAVRASGLPAAIVRPSVVGGDSQTGEIANFQGLHKAIASIVTGTVPVLPADADTPLDAIPSDLVARGVGRLIRGGITTGEYWLTAGKNSPTLGETVQLILEVAERLGVAPEHPPRLMPSEALDRLLLPLMEDAIPRALRTQFRGFIELMMLFQVSNSMESSFEELGMADEVTHEALLKAFEKSVEYWIATKMPAREAVA
ncbi:SDR family oxidoreductase [Kitasatospora sp. NPDC052868]|uniref:SDR family oxidoreductase n=1 Tax=Kitasatospora sp. NPDC052868 TaxID=3364060 RepID=UPI0037C731C9